MKKTDISSVGLGSRFDDHAALIEECTRSLHAEAVDAGMTVKNGRVDPRDAAKLLGYAPGTMRNWRTRREGPKPYRLAVNGSKLSYALRDLAELMVSRMQESD